VTPVDHRSAATGRLLALLGAACFGVNGTLSKLVLQAGLPADRLTALRSGGAAVVLLLVLAVRRPSSLRVSRREVPIILAGGVAGVALVQVLYFLAIARLPVGVALLIQFTAPVLVAVWSRFGLPRRARVEVGSRVWAALALVLVGLAVLSQVWDGVTLDPGGLLAATGSMVALAAFFVVGAHAMGEGSAAGEAGRDPVSYAALTFAVGAVVWGVLAPWWSFPVEVLGRTSEVGGVPVWLLCAGVVLVGTVASYLLSFGALRLLGPTDASVVGTVEPLLAGLVAWTVLGEVLTSAQLLGGAVVLAGILLAQTAPARAPGPEPAEPAPAAPAPAPHAG
jgi:drug/metabolite transporter (DMT)-like permease